MGPNVDKFEKLKHREIFTGIFSTTQHVAINKVQMQSICTPRLKKTVPVLFFNNCMKHWLILLISDTQHNKDA